MCDDRELPDPVLSTICPITRTGSVCSDLSSLCCEHFLLCADLYGSIVHPMCVVTTSLQLLADSVLLLVDRITC